MIPHKSREQASIILYLDLNRRHTSLMAPRQTQQIQSILRNNFGVICAYMFRVEKVTEFIGMPGH